MAHILIITAYNPEFSAELKFWVKKNINPSMVNAEPKDKEASYFLETIVDQFASMSEEDALLVAELQSQNVEYVEF